MSTLVLSICAGVVGRLPPPALLRPERRREEDAHHLHPARALRGRRRASAHSAAHLRGAFWQEDRVLNTRLELPHRDEPERGGQSGIFLVHVTRFHVSYFSECTSSHQVSSVRNTYILYLEVLSLFRKKQILLFPLNLLCICPDRPSEQLNK